MADILRAFNLKGYNTYSSPMQIEDGQMITLQNVDPYPYGAKTKRPGYGTVIGTMPNGSAVTTLFDFPRADGTTFWLYAAAGGEVYSSAQGTGAWTVTGNGTLTAGQYVGHNVLNDTLFIGDGVAATRHSTNGTSFTNTTIAPVGKYFTNYKNRLYVGGTANTLFWSTTGDGTNWSSSGTSDASSIDIPGEGRINTIYKASDRVLVTKDSGAMFRWDGFELVDLTTNLGPSSYASMADVEDYRFYINRYGFFGNGGNKSQLVSNPIQRVVYNNAQSGIAGTTFETAPGETFKYDYYCSVGTVTDDFTNKTTSNAVVRYNYQLNEWGVHSFGVQPTALLGYRDNNKVDQLLMGDATGKIYQYGGTAVSDNGSAIEAQMEFVISYGAPEKYKEWKECDFIFSPGNEAKVQVAASDSFNYASKNWIDLGDCSTGVAMFRPSGLRSRFLFVKIYESSTTNRFTFYGYTAEAKIVNL